MSTLLLRRASRLALVLAVVLVAAACTGGGFAAGRSGDTGGESVTDAAWRTAALVDARSGETFSIDGLEGRLVAIEPMAIWCSNCRTQQREAVAALAAVASDDLMYISLDVETNEERDVLARYADEQGFDWTFTVASTDVARSLAAEFGDQVLSPPATPLILLGPDGTVIETHYGIRRADELEALFRQHLP